ncbi:hypothetical protein COOONC_04090 [Cooperia oncophora]
MHAHALVVGSPASGCSLLFQVEAKQLHQSEVEKHRERERQAATVDDECRTASELMPAQDDGCRTASEPTARADDGCRTASEPSPKIDDGCRTASEPTPKALVSAQKPQDYAPSRISSEKTTEIMIKRTMERTVTEEDLHTAEPVRTPAGLEDAGCKTASLPEPVEAKHLQQSELEKHTERERQTATVVILL